MGSTLSLTRLRKPHDWATEPPPIHIGCVGTLCATIQRKIVGSDSSLRSRGRQHFEYAWFAVATTNKRKVATNVMGTAWRCVTRTLAALMLATWSDTGVTALAYDDEFVKKRPKGFWNLATSPALRAQRLVASAEATKAKKAKTGPAKKTAAKPAAGPPH